MIEDESQWATEPESIERGLRKIRIVRSWLWGISVAFPLVTIAILLIVPKTGWVVAAAIVWLSIFIPLAITHRNRRCPKCHMLFFVRKDGVTNYFAHRCLNCRLPLFPEEARERY